MPVRTPVIVAIKTDPSFIGQMTRWTLNSNATDALGFRDANFYGSVQFQNINGQNVCTMDQATIVQRGFYWKIGIDQSESGSQTVRFYVNGDQSVAGAEIATTTAPYGSAYTYAMVFHSNGDVDCYFNGVFVATATGQTFTAVDNQPITLGRDVDLTNPAQGHFDDWMTFNMALRAIDIAGIKQDYITWVDAGMGDLSTYVEAVDDLSIYIDPS
jgi:hypothetical protein